MTRPYRNPFDNEDLLFSVIVNKHNQHSIWPEFAAIPPGWDTVFGPSPRAACLSYVQQNWTSVTTE